eukprot:CAMPEP_0195011086 /NCGR_PEP_ID=MMETSP0326_2-20130528/10657_1 /TAXON_ID=2866 ORGANISM="Crypthecodinium cohnii, Strain Seligo" /NCGR_SAMPLE_ID=MMETSP0326_2 /ASSEMBLY_ACC=CAM_ASM_000348 /LENGTH=61 /DNA_ID=CAMNT_0040020033 /DNA_START=1 /DNA_END=183 /DNA_ORIENTATION=-
MSADVVEGMDLASLVASQDDGVRAHLDDLHIARFGQLGRMAGCEPLRTEDPLTLSLHVLAV